MRRKADYRHDPKDVKKGEYFVLVPMGVGECLFSETGERAREHAADGKGEDCEDQKFHDAFIVTHEICTVLRQRK